MTRSIPCPASESLESPDAGHQKAARAHGGRGIRSTILFLLLTLVVSPHGSLQQGDPVSNFCRRFGHQAAVVDDRLYIDGGFMNYNPLEQFPNNETNEYLFFHDISTVANSGMPQLYSNLSKNRTIPSLHGGILWPDPVNKRLYQFGGEFPAGDPATPFRGLYAYDVLADSWDYLSLERAEQSKPTTVVRRTSYGAGVAVPERGEGYWYGGWLSNRSEADWPAAADAASSSASGAQDGTTPRAATSYLLKYEMDRNAWTNSSGPDDVGRAEGAMVYIPAGDAGMLVYLGGLRDEHRNGSVVDGQPMDEILVYDVLSFKWYKQKASGDVPEMRSRFCAGVAWAEDRSSYNIYVYGGASMPPSTAGFDDVYILSLPSFTWIKFFPDSATTGEYPHHSLTCTVVGPSLSQMLIIGGTFPLTDMCDTPTQWGVHNLDLGRQNPEGAVWMLYDPEKGPYVVPSDVSDVVGGRAGGGATKTVPDAGFGSPDLAVLLARTASSAAREPTRDIPSGAASGGGLRRGEIAGVVVGSTAGLLAFALVALCVVRRRRKGAAPERPRDGLSGDDSGGAETPCEDSRAYVLPVPIQPIAPVELEAEQPLSPGPYTPTPDSDRGKESHWAREVWQGESSVGVGSGVEVEADHGAHELSATPGQGAGKGREKKIHATYYHR